MKVTPLRIAGSWQVEPVQHPDERGVFLEWLRQDVLAEHVGHPLDVKQANCSTFRPGVLRGVHFADIPPGQAKYVTCTVGTILDVVVDIRVGSPTFSEWDAVLLDDVTRRAVYVSEGLGHAFMGLSATATAIYVASAPYAPGREHGVHPLDPELSIEWPTHDVDGHPITPLLSPKDAAQPTLADAGRQGLLPTMEQADEFYSMLDLG